MTYVEDHMKASLEGHELEEIPLIAGRDNKDEDIARCFRLFRKKDSRMMSTFIWFLRETPGGHGSILITGDLCPRPGRNRGVISDGGYGIGWFRSKLSEGYLCEKFMGKEWQAEVAADWCAGEIEDIEEGISCSDMTDEERQGRVEALKELKSDLEYEGRMSGYEFYDEVQRISQSYTEDGCAGMDYPRGDAAWLCAIQQKFGELYNAMHPEPAEQQA